MQCRHGQAGRVEHERNSIFFFFLSFFFALTVRWRPRVYPYPTAGSLVVFVVVADRQTDTVRVAANVPHRLNPCVPPLVRKCVRPLYSTDIIVGFLRVTQIVRFLSAGCLIVHGSVGGRIPLLSVCCARVSGTHNCRSKK